MGVGTVAPLAERIGKKGLQPQSEQDAPTIPFEIL